MTRDVLVVIGVGGIGQAIARRLGSGKTVVLGDNDAATLQRAAACLTAEGHLVELRNVDVTSAASVRDLASTARELGAVSQVAHTAGLSPAQAPTAAILAVDLLGVAHVLDEFATVIAPGGAGVVIASMAGHLYPPLPADQQHVLAHTPAGELLSLPFLSPERLTDPGLAYAIAKQANHLRVVAAHSQWGSRGARINSISPGIISTPMGQRELNSPLGDGMRAMVDSSSASRLGTPDDIAAAAAFLLGPQSSFVTGTDLLIDGGVTAALRSAAS
ncbi:SDR family oxidoreductase [Mycobacterium intracellulare]|uniref:SDR family oxidoreductase n=1 Tax=Mycobacterium intracellulare TaxID=1767 RepID=UPI00080B2ED8|nr:SDR family oxidoreductase [Mycobacterium intracellulare]OCB07069.1 short-chain dehydrogenase [Mycobacterium intracellulare subsp. yongonense]